MASAHRPFTRNTSVQNGLIGERNQGAEDGDHCNKETNDLSTLVICCCCTPIASVRTFWVTRILVSILLSVSVSFATVLVILKYFSLTSLNIPLGEVGLNVTGCVTYEQFIIDLGGKSLLDRRREDGELGMCGSLLQEEVLEVSRLAYTVFEIFRRSRVLIANC